MFDESTDEVSPRLVSATDFSGVAASPAVDASPEMLELPEAPDVLGVDDAAGNGSDVAPDEAALTPTAGMTV